MKENILVEESIRIMRKGVGYLVPYTLVRHSRLDEKPYKDFNPTVLTENDKLVLKMYNITVFEGNLFTGNMEPSMDIYIDGVKITRAFVEQGKIYKNFAECCIRGVLDWYFYNEGMPQPIIGDTIEEMKQNIFVDPSYAILGLCKLDETPLSAKYNPIFTIDDVIESLEYIVE